MNRTLVNSVVRTANRLLAARYGTPRLGNKRHPVSELVFIVLSARTRGRHHEQVYRDMRRRFRTWEEVEAATLAQLEEVIRDAGLSRVKARQIKGLLGQLREQFGDLSGRQLRVMATRPLEAYLTTLPGVGLKTARCVMMYALDRPVFPVDTHCMRLFQHLGIVGGRIRLELAQDRLQDLVPRDIRLSLHVNTVALGRTTCVPRAERCGECPIASLCQKSAQFKEAGCPGNGRLPRAEALSGALAVRRGTGS